MRKFWFIACLAYAVLSSAQPSLRSINSPKEVVERFWKMETQGGRLGPEGWRAAASYFATTVEFPKERSIGVVSNHFSVWDAMIRDNSAEVTVGVGGLMWKIDPEMRVHTWSDQIKGFISYKLVLTDRHSGIASDRKASDVNTPREWRIEKEPTTIFLTLNTAIKYLTQVRDSTDDPAIKKNAEQSIAELKRHHR